MPKRRDLGDQVDEVRVIERFGGCPHGLLRPAFIKTGGDARAKIKAKQPDAGKTTKSGEGGIMAYTVRPANLNDIPAITRIYNQGIEDRVATLETALRSEEERKGWLQNRSERHPVLVAVDENDAAWGWASLNVFNARACYSGVAEISVYIERGCRGQGLGKLLLTQLEAVAREQGFHKLVLATFPYNRLGQGLYRRMGFREVGVYEKQGKLDGNWVDVMIMEKLFV